MPILSNIVIVIPTHGRPDRLKILLDSLDGVFKDAVPFPGRTYIIENGSNISEPTALAYNHFPDLTFVRTEYGNKSAALNMVLPDIHDEQLVIYFDDDIKIIDSSIFSAYAGAYEEFGEDYYYGGEFIAEYEKKPAERIAPFMPQSNRGFETGFTTPRASPQRHFLGFNWAVNAGKLKEIGGFNVAYGPGAKSGARGQETDAQKRLLANGMRPIVVPHTMVAHYVPEKYVSEEWVAQRKTLSGMQRGQLDGNFFKSMYWWVIAKTFSLPFNTLANRMRGAKYEGYYQGWKNKRNLND